jgi:hypothetical protein
VSYRPREWGRAVPLAELADHVGETIEIWTVDGKPYKVELESVEENLIKVKERMGAGHMAFSVRLSDITQIRVAD